MSNESIYSILLINGGEGKPANGLLERELYIDAEGNLYYGKTPMKSDGGPDATKKAAPSKVNAYRADFIESSTSNLFKFDAIENEAFLGGFKVEEKQFIGERNFDGSYGPSIREANIESCNFLTGYIEGGSIENTTLTGVTIASSLSITTSRVVLTNNTRYTSYGYDEPPSSGVEGQVYFKLTK